MTFCLRPLYPCWPLAAPASCLSAIKRMRWMLCRPHSNACFLTSAEGPAACCTVCTVRRAGQLAEAVGHSVTCGPPCCCTSQQLLHQQWPLDSVCVALQPQRGNTSQRHASWGATAASHLIEFVHDRELVFQRRCRRGMRAAVTCTARLPPLERCNWVVVMSLSLI